MDTDCRYGRRDAIRPAVPEDAEAIGEIRVRAWRAAYRGILPDEFLDSLDPSANLGQLRADLRQPSRTVVFRVAECEGKLAGFSVSGRPRHEVDSDAMELWALNVDPEAWRQGYGRALVSNALGEAESMGFSTMELWCVALNYAARALYEECGFSLSGRERTSSDLTGHPLHELSYEKKLWHSAPAE